MKLSGLGGSIQDGTCTRVVESRTKLADPKSEGLESHLSLGIERKTDRWVEKKRRTLAELTSLWMTGCRGPC